MLAPLGGGNILNPKLLTDGDVVVIVNGDQVAQLKMAGSRSSFAGDTLHGATVTEDHVGVVVNKVISGLVEDCGRVFLGNSQTNCVGETLA